MPTPYGCISPELPDSSKFCASPTALDDEAPRGASSTGARDAVDAAGLAGADIARKDAGSSATIESVGKLWWEANASVPCVRIHYLRKRGNDAAIPPTAKASSSGGCRALTRTCGRSTFHRFSTSTEETLPPPLPPASRGKVGLEEG